VTFILRIVVLLAILAFVILVNRGFCRVLCPLGAILALFNRISLFRVRLTQSECTNCGRCAKMCPVEIDPVGQMNSSECVRCLDCTATQHLKLGVKSSSCGSASSLAACSAAACVESDGRKETEVLRDAVISPAVDGAQADQTPAPRGGA